MNNIPVASLEVSLSEHLKGFSAVSVPINSALEALKKHLSHFGAVIETPIESLRGGLNYLAPIKSFTTRYLVLAIDNWSILITDMREANCYVEAFAISRATRCNAIGLFLREERRELQMFEDGEKVRQVQSLRDGDRWYYREEGRFQPFEDLGERLRNKDARLKVDLLQRYFKTYTGLSVPDWNSGDFSRIIGLERSTKNLRVPVAEFKTICDFCRTGQTRMESS